jgi:hypothetical protein
MGIGIDIVATTVSDVDVKIHVPLTSGDPVHSGFALAPLCCDFKVLFGGLWRPCSYLECSH